MAEAIAERAQEALSYLTPEERPIFQRCFRLLAEAHSELDTHPLRDGLDADEFLYYFGDVFGLADASSRLEESVHQRLQDVVNQWMALIEALDVSRTASFASRLRVQQHRLRVQVLLDTLTVSNTTAANLVSTPDDVASQCSICKDQLAQPEHTIVQLPCHPTHLFHRDCVQPWVEDYLNCPICRVEIELPPASDSHSDSDSDSDSEPDV
ncbi:zinc ion binding [Puccinia graminis f. sp. tritici]|uniref:Zinc ion binding n=1 Tax=Puccinia graminis f. sp. tritici TaxID=56615 RepID=A0A5B0NUT2_PUCGR|nr:zinc ion binding [Puccinia graminis f. sp. tritici]